MLFLLPKSKPLNVLAGLLLVIALPFFFIGGPTVYSTPLFRALWDCGHLLFFAGLVFALHYYVDFSKFRAGVVLSLVVFVLGGLIEIIQAHTGRDGNWQDLMRDMAGTWMGLFWLQKPNGWVWTGRIFAIALCIPTLSIVYAAAQAQRFAEQQFPVLGNFESDMDLHGVKGDIERSNAFHSRDQYSLKVHLTTKQYTNVSFNDFFNSWQGYNYLLLDLYNPSTQPLDLVIRIDDVQHQAGNNEHDDRFNKNLHLEPGWNAIQIPVDEIQHAPAKRLLQLDAIKMIVIFAVQLQQEQDIYLDNMRLQ